MPTRRMSAARLGKMPTTAVRRLISLLSRSWGLVAAELAPVTVGKGEAAEQVRPGGGEQLGDGCEAWPEARRRRDPDWTRRTGIAASTRNGGALGSIGRKPALTSARNTRRIRVMWRRWAAARSASRLPSWTNRLRALYAAVRLISSSKLVVRLRSPDEVEPRKGIARIVDVRSHDSQRSRRPEELPKPNGSEKRRQSVEPLVHRCLRILSREPDRQGDQVDGRHLRSRSIVPLLDTPAAGNCPGHDSGRPVRIIDREGTRDECLVLDRPVEEALSDQAYPVSVHHGATLAGGQWTRSPWAAGRSVSVARGRVHRTRPDEHLLVPRPHVAVPIAQRHLDLCGVSIVVTAVLLSGLDQVARVLSIRAQQLARVKCVGQHVNVEAALGTPRRAGRSRLPTRTH